MQNSNTGKLHKQQPGHYKDRGGDSQCIHRLRKKDNAREECAYCTYARPNRVGSTEWNSPHGNRQQPKATQHGDKGDKGRCEPGEAEGLLHGERPNYFQGSGNEKIQPGH